MPKPWPFVETPAIAIERGANSASMSSGGRASGWNRRGRVEDEAGVRRHRAVRARDHRVALELAEVGAEARRQPVRPRDAEEDLHERVAVDRRGAADAAEHRRALETVEHGLGVGLVDRDEARDDVVEDLGQRAAETDRDHRAERRPAHHADQQLDRPRDLLLDEPAVSFEPVRAQLRRHRRDRLFDLGRLDADPHRPDVGLVHDPLAVRLDHDGAVEAIGGLLRDVGFVAARAERGDLDTALRERDLHERFGDDDPA